MTQREIARLACKVLAVYFVLHSLTLMQQAVAQLSRAFAAISQGDAWGWPAFWYQLPVVLFPVVQVFVAIWLWKRAGLVAAWMSSHDLQDDQDEPEGARIPADLDGIHAVVLSSLGIWVMLMVLPDVISMMLSFVVDLIASPKQALEYAGRGVSSKIWIWVPQVALGIWLIFGSSGIVRMRKKFRPAGLQPNERPPAAQ